MQDVREEIEEAFLDFGATAFGFRDGFLNAPLVFRRHFVAVGNDIGAVDLEASRDVANGATDLRAGEVAEVAVGFADGDKDVGDAVDIAGQRFLGDARLLFKGDVVEVGGLVREVAIDFGELSEAFRMDKQAVAQIQEVVAAGAFHGPFGAEPFAGFEDFFNNDPGIRRAFAQTLQVLPRIAQAIWMIDADAIKNSLLNPIQDELMCFLKDVLALHAQADE